MSLVIFSLHPLQSAQSSFSAFHLQPKVHTLSSEFNQLSYIKVLQIANVLTKINIIILQPNVQLNY